ncbi:MAG TPA: hypothetical protein VFS53_01670 [Gemmatimonadota bacterium]|nr:hypothetical protein [Gemmatimonadota bacterium]
MLDDRISRVALAVSLLVHGVLIAPLWERWSPIAADPATVVASPPSEPIAFRIVDPQPGPDAAPDTPTPNLSDADRRASQPDAPADLPDGEAYRAGTSPIPSIPRPAGAAARPAAPASPPASRPAARAAERASGARELPAAEDGTRARAETPGEEAEDAAPPRPEPGRTDPRLTLGPTRIASPPAPPAPSPAAPGGRLPVPEVDQRLTRAEAGSAFSLNTTAWEWAPYMQRLKARIEQHISPPAAFYYGTAAWISRVRFRIGPDGRLLEFRLLDHRGVENLQYVALDAITGAADYEPLPPGFPEPYLEITGNFYFNVFPSDDR